MLDDLSCDGDELSLLECDFDPDTSDCTHFEDAGLRCIESISELEVYSLQETVLTISFYSGM